MTALREYQRTFAAALATGDAGPVLSLFEGPVARRQRGFKVYANNRMHALVSALAATFPALRRILGEQAFTALAIAYVRAQPLPREALLLWYGVQLPAFLESLEGITAPHLADLARLEYAWLEAYHAAEAEPLSPQHLAALTPEQLVAARFTLHPSVRLLRSSWPIDQIWRRQRDDTGTRDGPKEEGQEEGEEEERCLVVARPETAMMVLPVSAAGFVSLAAFRDGAAFADATAHLGEARHLAELQRLIAAGLFTAIET